MTIIVTIIVARRPVRLPGLDAAHETWSPWEPRLKLVTQMVPRYPGDPGDSEISRRYPGDIAEPETRDDPGPVSRMRMRAHPETRDGAGMKVIRVSPEF